MFTTFYQRQDHLKWPGWIRECSYQPDLKVVSDLSDLDHMIPSSQLHDDETDTDYTLWFPQFPYHMQAAQIPPAHRWNGNPYLRAPCLQLAPVFLTHKHHIFQSHKIIARFFTDQTLKISLTRRACESIAASGSIYTGFADQDNTPHRHLVIYRLLKLKYLIAHESKKMFYVCSQEDIKFLDMIKQAWPGESLWLQLSKDFYAHKDAHKSYFQGFICHGFPDSPLISVTDLKRALDDPQMITPLYHTLNRNSITSPR